MSLMSIFIDAPEVLVARSAAEPCLPKVQPTCEEEAAGPWFHSTPQQGVDVACGFAIFANRLEQGELLAVDASGAHTDDGFLQLDVIGDAPDVATNN